MFKAWYLGCLAEKPWFRTGSLRNGCYVVTSGFYLPCLKRERKKEKGKEGDQDKAFLSQLSWP